jgi:hypothetical protein
MMAQPTEFWLVAVPPNAGPDSSLTLIDVKPSKDEAVHAVEALPTATPGRVAVLERIVLFNLELAVRTVESNQAVAGIAGRP